MLVVRLGLSSHYNSVYLSVLRYSVHCGHCAQCECTVHVPESLKFAPLLHMHCVRQGSAPPEAQTVYAPLSTPDSRCDIVHGVVLRSVTID